MQVSTLVALRLLGQGGGDPLDGGVQYRCALSDESAAALAANLRLRVTDYLKMG